MSRAEWAAGRLLAVERPAPTVQDLMRSAPPPAEPDDRLSSAAARMRAARLDALPVVDGDRLVGLITIRDVLLAVADGLSTDVTRVGDYMRAVSGVIGPEAPASSAASRMIELRQRHLPVVSGGRIVGLVSARDLLLEWGVPAGLLGDEPL